MLKKPPECGKKKMSEPKSGNEMRIESITETHGSRRCTNVARNMF